MRAVLCGANGAMGQLIAGILGSEVVGSVSLDGANGVARTFQELGKVEADVVIDFSHHSAIADVLDYAKSIGAAAVIGTTGHTEAEKQLIFRAANQLPVFYSGNMSLGIALLCQLTRQTVALFPDADVEIVEVHHNRKVDAPSGTARMLFEAVKAERPDAIEHDGRSGECKREKNEVGIASLRMGGIVGVHEVHVCTASQSITLRHEVYNRTMLAEGGVEAARFMVGKPAGMYSMADLLKGN